MSSRRSLLSIAAGAAAIFALPARDEGAIAPVEDLMREHGILRRILLVYDEAARRLLTGEAAPLDAIEHGAGLVRRVIEDYHERMEEQLVFPRFDRAGVQRSLVATLFRQHQAGRWVTGEILAGVRRPASDLQRANLAAHLAAFSRMYRPHAAREDTVLFPALHRIITEAELKRLGDLFESRERKAIGANGFERAVGDVAALERALGIDDLDRVTPKIG